MTADDELQKTMDGHNRMHPPYLQLQTSTYLIVPDWSTESIYGLTGAMLAAVVSSVCLECMHEYLNYLRRKALLKPTGPECCGVPVVSVWEKLGQTIIHVLRVLFAYFAMFCLMTMNIWLFVSIVIGAFIGYGIGKPLVANQINDSVTSHGYDTLQIRLANNNGHLRNNRSQRSRSWRYQPINRPDLVLKKRQFDEDVTFSENGGADNSRNSADIVWIRRSSDDLRMKASESSVFDDSELQVRTTDESSLRSPDNTLNFGSIRSTRSAGRFRSTSKIINDSFRSNKSDHSVVKYSVSASSSANVSFESNTLDSVDRRSLGTKRIASKAKRSTSTTSSRFKPVSREINRQISFNSEYDY